jgi:hypothetical protein
MGKDSAEKTVAAQIKAELGEAERNLRSLLKRQKDAVKVADRASDVYWKHARKSGFDNEPSEAEKQAEYDNAQAVRALDSVTRSITKERERIARLKTPEELERRINEREATDRRIADLKARQGEKGTKMSTTVSEPRHKHVVPDSVRKSIVEALKGGLSPRAVADDLNKRKVKAPGASKAWIPNHVFVVMVEDTSFDSMKALRKKHPLKSKAVAAQPPRATTKLAGRKNGTARPLSRKAQAAGTSRGGTGKKQTGRKAASKKAATAKK